MQMIQRKMQTNEINAVFLISNYWATFQTSTYDEKVLNIIFYYFVACE